MVVLAHKWQVDQWSRIEKSKINSHTCSQLNFSKEGKNNQWEKESLQQVVLGKLDSCTYISEVRTYSDIIHKRHDTIKLLEENIIKHSKINLSSIFFVQSPKAIEIKINKWDLIKLVIFGPAKETINKMERQPMD